jgi:hypothetical protein
VARHNVAWGDLESYPDVHGVVSDLFYAAPKRCQCDVSVVRLMVLLLLLSQQSIRSWCVPSFGSHPGMFRRPPTANSGVAGAGPPLGSKTNIPGKTSKRNEAFADRRRKVNCAHAHGCIRQIPVLLLDTGTSPLNRGAGIHVAP